MFFQKGERGSGEGMDSAYSFLLPSVDEMTAVLHCTRNEICRILIFAAAVNNESA